MGTTAQPPVTVVAATGNWGTVEFAVRPSGSVPAQEFMDDDLVDQGRAFFAMLFQTMANSGFVHRNSFKIEMKGLRAFRHTINNRLVRFPCFQDGTRWILTHGFFKPGARGGKGKWPKNEINRAVTIMSEYWERKKAVQSAAAKS